MNAELGSFLQIVFPASCQLNQHLQDSLCQQLLQLDQVSILSPATSTGKAEEVAEEGDMEHQVHHCRSDDYM